MEILKPRNEVHYQVSIHFKIGTDRASVNAQMPRREYKRLLKDIQRGITNHTYEMIIDGHVTEFTFPIQEIDTVFAVPETDNGEHSGNSSE